MRLSELKDIVINNVEVYKDNGQLSFDTLFVGEFKNIPVRVQGLFVGQIWTSKIDDVFRILVFDTPVN